MNAKYYVLAKTLWAGDDWSVIAGPFTNKDEVNQVAENNRNNGINSYGQQNLKSVVNTLVCNTTQMKKWYGITKEQALEQLMYVHYMENL